MELSHHNNWSCRPSSLTRSRIAVSVRKSVVVRFFQGRATERKAGGQSAKLGRAFNEGDGQVRVRRQTSGG